MAEPLENGVTFIGTRLVTRFVNLPVRELRFAIRSLLRTPAVTGAAVLSVALGIGANVAIFSVFNQLLLRPLPVHEPERLVNLVSRGPRSGTVSCGDAGTCDEIFSYPMFRDLEQVQTVFTGLAAHRDFDVSIAYDGGSERGDAVLVSGSYFSVLGLSPAAGRLLRPDDEREMGGGSVVILSYDYWRTRFGARADVVGQVLHANGQALTIVGVAPAGFDGASLGARPLLFVPISMREIVVPRWKGLDNRRSYWVYLFARLKPGVSREAARAAFNPQYRSILTGVDVPLQQGMGASMLARFRSMEMDLEPGAQGQSRVPEESRQPLTLLLGVTVLVLLVCCANVANLLLGRAASRSTEMAVRLSIGAGARHIIGQLLAESVLLAIAGGLGGLLISRWTLSALAAIAPPGLGGDLRLELDGDMLLVAAGLALVTGVLSGLGPAIHGTRPNLVTALKANAGQPSGAKRAARFRITLATAQIALSMALLVSAGLFARSLSNITRVDLGLRTDRLVVFGVSPAMSGYSADRTRRLLEAIEDAVAAQPGVASVTASRIRLVSGSASTSEFKILGTPDDPEADAGAYYNFVGPDYLRTLGISLMAGREFSRSDTIDRPRVAIVSEAFLRKFHLGRDAVGARMYRAGREGIEITIVGVAADSVYDEVKGQPDALVLMPYRQDPDLAGAHVYARTRAAEADLLAAIPGVVRGVDSNVPVADLRTMTTQVRGNVSLDRFVTSLSAAFAVLATLLSALGLYGVLAYTVTQRMREFGLRMALGARASDVRQLVLRQVTLMTGVGVAIGLASALAFGRAAESLLFQINARDPFVFAGATLVLAGVAVCAGLIPAQRAARVDPMTALRYE